MKTNKKYVTCVKCGKVDKPRKPTFDADGVTITTYNTGTATVMKCQDCGGNSHDKHALRCRECCPTGHGTRFEDDVVIVSFHPDLMTDEPIKPVRPKSELKREWTEKYGTKEDI